MSKRQHEHFGRSTDERRTIPGRDERADIQVRSETIAHAEEARDISRLIDEDEGYARQDHRHPQTGASRGRKTRNRKA